MPRRSLPSPFPKRIWIWLILFSWVGFTASIKCLKCVDEASCASPQEIDCTSLARARNATVHLCSASFSNGKVTKRGCGEGEQMKGTVCHDTTNDKVCDCYEDLCNNWSKPPEITAADADDADSGKDNKKSKGGVGGLKSWNNLMWMGLGLILVFILARS